MNEDLYGLEASGIDPEIAAKMLGAKRQRKVTEAMLQQSMSPMNPNRVASGGIAVPISAFEALAKVAQVYMGKKGMESADKELAGLASENQKKVAEAMAGYEKKRMGDPGIQMPTAVDDEGNSNAPNEVAPVKGDPRRAIAEAMASPLLQKNPIVGMDAKAYEKSQEPYTLTAGAQRFGPDNKPLAAAGFKPERPRPPMNDFQIAQLKDMVMKATDMGMDASGLQQELQMAIAGRDAIRGSQPAAPQPAPVTAPAAPAGIPPEVIAAATAGKPFVATQAPGQPVQFGQPPVGNMAPRDQRLIAVDQAKADIDAATKVKDMENKRQFNMTGIADAVKSSRSLLTGIDPVSGEKIELPTASGLGNIADSVGAFFGKSLDGSKTADRLRVAGGSLVSKVPRFEGPQSNADTLYYQAVAGRIGDATLPRDRRLAALDEVENIWGAFEKGKKSGFAPSNSASGTIRRDVPEDIANLLSTYGKPRGQ